MKEKVFQDMLDIVSVSESLPENWEGNEIEYFTGYVTLLSADITYIPSDSSFTGTHCIHADICLARRQHI